jgi:hypothetical protein
VVLGGIGLEKKDALFLLDDLTTLEKHYGQLMKQLIKEPTIAEEEGMLVELQSLVTDAEQQDPESKCFLAIQLYLSVVACKQGQQASKDEAVARLSAQKGSRSDYSKLLISYLEKDPIRMVPYVEELDHA